MWHYFLTSHLVHLILLYKSLGLLFHVSVTLSTVSIAQKALYQAPNNKIPHLLSTYAHNLSMRPSLGSSQTLDTTH